MIEYLIIFVAAFVIAALLFSIVKKLIKVAVFIALVFVLFIVISHFIFPEISVIEKGKNYILGKAQTTIEYGKDITAYVIVEGNNTINKLKKEG